MKIGTYFAIRERGTNRFIPRAIRDGVRRTGITAYEPIETAEPELYASAASAAQALRLWARGIGFVDKVRPLDGSRQLAFTEVASRSAEAMEVVPVALTVEG